jgi:hypothetical protein
MNKSGFARTSESLETFEDRRKFLGGRKEKGPGVIGDVDKTKLF